MVVQSYNPPVVPSFHIEDCQIFERTGCPASFCQTLISMSHLCCFCNLVFSKNRILLGCNKSQDLADSGMNLRGGHIAGIQLALPHCSTSLTSIILEAKQEKMLETTNVCFSTYIKKMSAYIHKSYGFILYFLEQFPSFNLSFHYIRESLMRKLYEILKIFRNSKKNSFKVNIFLGKKFTFILCNFLVRMLQYFF